MYREKTAGNQEGDDLAKNVQYFDKKREDRDPETKYASLPELNASGHEKPASLQDDFDGDDEDI